MIPQSWKKFNQWINTGAPKRVCASRVRRHLLERESAEKGGGVKRARANAVAKHYLAIRTAWCLRHGEPVIFGPRNIKRLSAFIGFVTSIIREGPKALKSFSHLSRLQALVVDTNDRAARKEFLASTVARSVHFPVTKDALNSSVESAIRRWSERRGDSSLFADLERYIEHLPLRPFEDGELPEWPIPNDHACLTHTIKEGGTAMALVELETRIKLEALDFLFTGIQQPTYSESLTGIFPSDRVAELFDDFDDVADVMEGTGSLPDGPRITGYYIRSTEPALRPLPICEMGGKIRVVTLHPAEEIHVARRITSLWLNRLTGLVTSRAMLKNEEVVIERSSRDAKLYSADLSAATDYINHDLACHTAVLLCKKLRRPGDIPIVQKLFGSKQLPDGTHTASGVHMGLGPTWIILSLLNGFAAWHAGMHSSTYRICGDDLIGFWDKPAVLRYESALERLGLVVNKSKSFFGRRGVFCERIVEQDGNRAVAKDIGHLSALTAAKLTARLSRNANAVADSLRDSYVLRRVSDPVRQRLVPRGMGGGRVRHGGSGFGHLSHSGLTFALKRSLDLTVKDALPEGVMQQVKSASSERRGRMDIPVSQFLITLRTAIQARAYLEGKKLVTRPLTKAEFRTMGSANKRRPKNALDQLRRATQGSPLRSADKKTILRLLSGKIKSSKSRRDARLESIISRPHAERYISQELANSIILTHTHLDFGRRVERAAGVPNRQTPNPPTVPLLLVTVRTTAH